MRITHPSAALFFSLERDTGGSWKNPANGKRRSGGMRPTTGGCGMRMGVLIALCGGVALFALGAYREGSYIQGTIILAIVFGIMSLAMWFKDKGGDK